MISINRLLAATSALLAAASAVILSPAQDTPAAGQKVDEWIWVPVADPEADADFATIRHRIEMDLHRGPVFAPLDKESASFVKEMQDEVKESASGSDCLAGTRGCSVARKFRNMLSVWSKMQRGVDDDFKQQLDSHAIRYAKKFHLGLMHYLFDTFLPEDPTGYHPLMYGMTAVENCGAPDCWEQSSWKRPEPLPLSSLPNNLPSYLQAPPYRPQAGRPAEEVADELFCWSASLMETLVPQTHPSEYVSQPAHHILGWHGLITKLASSAAQRVLADKLLEYLWGAPLGTPSLEGPFSIASAIKKGWTTVVQRFPLRQQNKVRMIDPLVPQNKVSFLERSVPMSSAMEILAQASALAQPGKAGHGIVRMDKRTIKKCKVLDRGYLAQTDEFLLNKGPAPDPVFFNQGFDPSLPPDLAKVQAPKGDGSVKDETATSPFSLEEAVDLAAVAVAGYIVDVLRAYNNVAIRSDHLPYNRIVVYSPVYRRFAAFQGLVCMFGNVHSVVGWVRPYHGLVKIFRKLMKTLLEVYVDDATGIVPAAFAKEFLECFLLYLDTLGIPYSDIKIQIGTTLTVLGLLFTFTKKVPVFTVDAKRKSVITKLIDEALRTGHLTGAQARRLQGKISFVFTSLLDRAMNPILRPLYARSAEMDASSVIHAKLKATLLAVKFTINRQIMRTVTWEKPLGLRCVVYTDASFANGFGYLAGVIPLIIAGSIRFLWWHAPVSRADLHHSIGRQPIAFLEALAAVFSLRLFRNYLSSQFTYLYVDNTACEGALLAQGSKSPSLAYLCFEYWSFSAKNQISSFISRVASKLNISDIFTREELFRYFLRSAQHKNLFIQHELTKEETEMLRQYLQLKPVSASIDIPHDFFSDK